MRQAVHWPSTQARAVTTGMHQNAAIGATGAIIQDLRVDTGNDEMLLDECGDFNEEPVMLPGLQAFTLPEHSDDDDIRGVLLRNCHISFLQVGNLLTAEEQTTLISKVSALLDS
jgi:hypothetical protein